MKKTNTPASHILLVGQIAAITSISAFSFYLRQSDLLLYGDAVAHINIARRVFDSRTPGLLQLGTVWLPLPHLLMLPFLTLRWLWQSGVGGSIPSLFAYVFSVIGIFRLVQNLVLYSAGRNISGTRFAPWLAALIFAFNPNLIYLQTTAMTEPIYLAFFIWALIYFCEALASCYHADHTKMRGLLTGSGFCVAAACLTRYDGWFLAVALAAVLVALSTRPNFAPLRKGMTKFLLLAAAAPALWLAYNAAVYGNPLEFANGPYSAKAIEQKTAVPGTPPHPGTDNLPVAFHYFFKAGELNMAPGRLQLFWVSALLFGTAVILLFQRKLWPLALLWIPVPFYMLSIAYSGVPMFVPAWWPFSYYNVRYGIEMLPAFSIFTAIAAYGLIRFAASTSARLVIAVVFIVLAAGSYAAVWHAGPVSFQEAMINSRSRIALEKSLANTLEMMPPDSTFLMYLGDHVGAFQRVGIPLSRVINEGNHRTWKRPTDRDGLWERALANPAQYSDFVIALDGDPVAAAVNQKELVPLEVLHVTGQPQATIYRTIKSNQPR